MWTKSNFTNKLKPNWILYVLFPPDLVNEQTYHKVTLNKYLKFKLKFSEKNPNQIIGVHKVLKLVKQSGRK